METGRIERRWLASEPEKPQEERFAVRFERPFDWVPSVAAFFSEMDVRVGEDRTLRLSAEVTEVSKESATIIVRTWLDTKIHGYVVTWMAFGEL